MAKHWVEVIDDAYKSYTWNAIPNSKLKFINSSLLDCVIADLTGLATFVVADTNKALCFSSNFTNSRQYKNVATIKIKIQTRNYLE